MMWPDENKLIATFSIWSIKIFVDALCWKPWRNQAMAKFFFFLPNYKKWPATYFYLETSSCAKHHRSACVCFFFFYCSFFVSVRFGNSHKFISYSVNFFLLFSFAWFGQAYPKYWICCSFLALFLAVLQRLCIPKHNIFFNLSEKKNMA